jgi:hypothetical protein
MCDSPHPAGGSGASGTITTDSVIPKLRALAKDKNVAAGARPAAATRRKHAALAAQAVN